jgi:hypothetical protein
MVRSILAIVAGLIVLTIASFSIEFSVNYALLLSGAFPDQASLDASVPLKLFMMTYTFLCVAAGGYATARLAPHSPAKHALIMGALETLMTIDVMYTFPGFAPLWTWLVSIPLIVPAAWFGARLHRPSERAMIL